jgi:hypothetical protein
VIGHVCANASVAAAASFGFQLQGFHLLAQRRQLRILLRHGAPLPAQLPQRLTTSLPRPGKLLQCLRAPGSSATPRCSSHAPHSSRHSALRLQLQARGFDARAGISRRAKLHRSEDIFTPASCQRSW